VTDVTLSSDELSRASRTVIQSYVWQEGTERGYFVSTIDRESSAALAYGARYLETMVWRFENKTRTDIIYSGEGPLEHFRVCKHLMVHGEEGLDHER
jgi:hypothetical protein